MRTFPQEKSAREGHEVRQRIISCRRRLRRQRVARDTCACDARGTEAGDDAATMQGIDEGRARTEEVEEGYEAHSGDSRDNDEELDEACAGIGG
ncbi:MAG TPA: hypothetical protein VM911_22875 [Pyrinomonadaceae bacterium]|jgi:hypothetical protein|nr:hypothetical protein [Pyrinomonadaceae bacterium]